MILSSLFDKDRPRLKDCYRSKEISEKVRKDLFL